MAGQRPGPFGTLEARVRRGRGHFQYRRPLALRVPVTTPTAYVPHANSGHAVLVTNAATARPWSTPALRFWGGRSRYARQPPAAQLPLGLPSRLPTLDDCPLRGIVGIDMPARLLRRGLRVADVSPSALAARRHCRLDPAPARSGLFQPTPRPTRLAASSAVKACPPRTWGAARKILDADAYRRTSATGLHEVHPSSRSPHRVRAARRTASTPRRASSSAVNGSLAGVHPAAPNRLRTRELPARRRRRGWSALRSLLRCRHPHLPASSTPSTARDRHPLLPTSPRHLPTTSRCQRRIRAPRTRLEQVQPLPAVPRADTRAAGSGHVP